MNLQNDEFALSKDLMVSLWTQYRSFTGNEPLREVNGGDFVIVDNDLYDDFKEFKKNGETFEYCIVEAVDLLKYWSRLKKKEVKTVNIIGNSYFLMLPFELD